MARFALQWVPGYGASKVRRSFSVALPASLTSSEALAELAPQSTNLEIVSAIDKARKAVERSEDAGIQILDFDNSRYPEPLRRIPDPPPFIHFRGILPTEWHYAIAVIGTREAAVEAISAIDEVVAALSASPEVIVVSGLAKGSDTIAHAAALRNKVRTIAVLAHGLDTVYPRGNAELAQRIVDEGGCLLSEYAFGEPLSRYNLVARDRLQSGLSIAVIVAQTSVGGGSMHTALFALQQGRRLVALEPFDHSDEWSGNLALISRDFTVAQIKQWDRYSKFERPFAIRMPRQSIRPFIHAGLRSGFVPRRGASESPTAAEFSLVNSRSEAVVGQTVAPAESIAVPGFERISPKVGNRPGLSSHGVVARADSLLSFLASHSAFSKAECDELLASLSVRVARVVLRPSNLALGERLDVGDSDIEVGLLAPVESVTCSGSIVSLKRNDDNRVSALEASFPSEVSGTAALSVIRDAFSVISGACVLQFGRPLTARRLVIEGITGARVYEVVAGSPASVRYSDLVFPTVMHKIVAEFDEALRVTSDALGFSATYRLFDYVLTRWNSLIVGRAKEQGVKVSDLKRMRVSPELDSLFPETRALTYGAVLKSFRLVHDAMLRSVGTLGSYQSNFRSRALLSVVLNEVLLSSRDIVNRLSLQGISFGQADGQMPSETTAGDNRLDLMLT